MFWAPPTSWLLGSEEENHEVDLLSKLVSLARTKRVLVTRNKQGLMEHDAGYLTVLSRHTYLVFSCGELNAGLNVLIFRFLDSLCYFQSPLCCRGSPVLQCRLEVSNSNPFFRAFVVGWNEYNDQGVNMLASPGESTRIPFQGGSRK